MNYVSVSSALWTQSASLMLLSIPARVRRKVNLFIRSIVSEGWTNVLHMEEQKVHSHNPLVLGQVDVAKTG